MRHLILCPEFRPSPIPPGGIGTYVQNIARLLAEHGETVHVIAQLWEGAPNPLVRECDGRLHIHRVPLTGSFGNTRPTALEQRMASSLLRSEFPSQCFSWQAARLAEQLVVQERIDVIESQEWDAPLYYLQLRRALGLGPVQRPPCIVHLHSPTELIFLHNGWDTGRPDFLTAKRHEDYSIGAADSWLCPSRFLAGQAEEHYGLAPGSVNVIPLPIGDLPEIRRDRDVWRRGSVCYVGRLEPRKGVIEWVDAAVSVAPHFPGVRFELVGADLPYTAASSVREHVERRIPQELKSRFVFHGSKDRAGLQQLLRQARIAVVPSRWENFPNTCVEAMCSGLPVLATPDGGMREMVRDAHSGWISRCGGAPALADALVRALTTPPDSLATMGKNASTAIREMCCNERIVEQHLRVRAEVMERGACRSLRVPVNLPWARQPLRDESARRTARVQAAGVAVVVTAVDDASLDACLHSIDEQTQRPIAVMLVRRSAAPAITATLVGTPGGGLAQVVQCPSESLALARAAGLEALVRRGVSALAVTFVDAHDRLHPTYVESVGAIFERAAEVGIVSCWTQQDGQVRVPSCPAFPYQWVEDEVTPASAFRTEALLELEPARALGHPAYERWEMANAVLANGWAAVTAPEILAERVDGPSAASTASSDTPRHWEMRHLMLGRHLELVERDTRDVVLLLESRTRARRGARGGTAVPTAYVPLTPRMLLRLPLRDKILVARRALRDPGKATSWMSYHGRQVAHKVRRLMLRSRGQSGQ